MARLHSELVLGLNDQVSGPARRLNQNLENLRHTQMRQQQQFARNRDVFVGTAVAAYAMARALSAPIQASTEFSTQLEDIRQKADLSTEAIEGIGKASRQIGLDTGQGAGKITGAIDSLVGFGAVTPDQAVELATPIGKAATAYRADPTDLAVAVNAMISNFGIAVSEATYGLDMLAQSGKDGGFEIKDMASEFPGITAAARGIGMGGTDDLASLVSWLQVSRTNTANGSEAANNFMNFMQKVQAEQATKAFDEVGVDIGAEIKRAIAEGQDPIEHVLGILQKLTGGDKQKIQEFFSDAQVLKFIDAALPNIEKYNELNTSAIGAEGTLEKDFIDRSETPAAVQARFWASMENLNIVVGDQLVPELTKFTKSITPMIDGVSEFVEANGDLTRAVIEITAALIGLRLLASAGGMIGALLGMNGKGGNPLSLLGIDGKNNKTPNGPDGKSGGGDFFSKAAGLFGIFELAKFANSQGVGEDMFSPEKTLDYNIVHAADPGLARLMYGKGGGNVQPASPLQEQIAALRADIARLEGANLPVPPVELPFMKAELEELEAQALATGLASGQNLAIGIGSQGPALDAEMARIMATLRATIDSGIQIPITLGPGPRIGAAPSLYPPSMPSGPRAQAGPVLQTTTVGDVHVSVASTNANPQQIGRQVGQQVADRVRASHSNGGMD